MAAAFSLDAVSSLTDRYQTTVPEPVRRALKLRKRDRIAYHIEGDEVVLRRADAQSDGDDPALGSFLAFLARDVHDNPQRLRQLDPALVKRARSLVSRVEVDLDAPLSPDDE